MRENGYWGDREVLGTLRYSIFQDAVNHRADCKLFSRILPLTIRAMDSRIATAEFKLIERLKISG